MATSKTKSPRRRELQRQFGRTSPLSWQGLREHRMSWPVVWAAAAALCGGLLAVFVGGTPRYKVDQLVSEPIVARVRFQAVDQEKTRAKREVAYQNQPAVYVPNTEYFNSVRQRLDSLIKLAADKNIESVEQVREEERRAMRLDAAGFDELRKLVVDGKVDPKWTEAVERFLKSFRATAILKPERVSMMRDPDSGRSLFILLNDPELSKETELPYNVLLSTDDPKRVELRLQSMVDAFPAALRPTIIAAVMRDLQWTYEIDTVATQRRRDEARDKTTPETMTYEPSQVLVPAGHVLTRLDLDVINEEQRVFEVSAKSRYGWHWLAGTVGRFGLITLVAVGLWCYIAAYMPRVCSNPMRGLALTLLVVGGQVIAVALSGLGPAFLVMAAVFPTLLTATVLAICYGQRFALAIGAIHAVLVALTLQLPVPLMLVTLSGVVVAVSQLRDVRTRSKLVLIGVVTGGALFAATLLAGLAWRPLYLMDEYVVQLWRITAIDAAMALLTAVITGLLVQGVLPAIERLFNVTTAMTLRELNDASHPLLRRLAQDAPGTYQHSLRLADISEAAAEAIGADGLLCRVGAMYHDIGKLNKPQYFAENQGGGKNRHDKLSPAMSVLIIVGHVKDGAEMAREHRLPQPIRHFIESHHGTTLVEYFYHAARKHSDEQDLPQPDEFEFRYPGPKPQNKEAAILMLGDAVESAARTLDEPTPGRLEQLVTTMARKRLMDGQFDECNLTLAELHKIEQAMHRTMCAVYHGRVKYPGDEREPSKPTQAEAPAPSEAGVAAS